MIQDTGQLSGEMKGGGRGGGGRGGEEGGGGGKEGGGEEGGEEGGRRSGTTWTTNSMFTFSATPTAEIVPHSPLAINTEFYGSIKIEVSKFTTVDGWFKDGVQIDFASAQRDNIK